ncbi:protoporphyrinogen/coproporphyrinogen oxidase [Shewanella xiamenensis]|uniref:protoporphyrinogen/coproporphyrinogen oxidase n=1 Tax=Shewanella xiamenensis TaxID=332186 RepID=UPI00313CCA73
MKIAIIGAGVSGMSFAKLCMRDKLADVVIFEAQKFHGGLARVEDVNGYPYHLTGGHCFNSKYPEVLDFVFNDVLSKDNWNLIERKADIMFEGHSIPYPIEFSLKQIAEFNPILATNIVKDFIEAQQKNLPSMNLKEWFVNNFGYSLATEYLIPYNTKIWGRDISSMSPNWVSDKLPMPNVNSFILGLLKSGSDNMPHNNFYYPKSGTQQQFLDALREGLDIRFNSKIEGIKKDNSGKYVIENEIFDKVIYTGPLDNSCYVFDIANLKDACSKLEFNVVTTMLWEREACEETWTYLPDSTCTYHRLIHIGNFLLPKQNISIAEAVGERSYDEMVIAGSKIPSLSKPIGYHVSNHAYVVFDDNRDNSVNVITRILKENDVHCLGRFGEWEYYNMDICIKSAMTLAEEIKVI